MALRVLPMAPRAGASRRNWCMYDFVQSKKRTCLTPKRANDLVNIYTNIRLGKRCRASESFVEWGEGPEMTKEERGQVE